MRAGAAGPGDIEDGGIKLDVRSFTKVPEDDASKFTIMLGDPIWETTLPFKQLRAKRPKAAAKDAETIKLPFGLTLDADLMPTDETKGKDDAGCGAETEEDDEHDELKKREEEDGDRDDSEDPGDESPSEKDDTEDDVIQAPTSITSVIVGTREKATEG